MSDPKHAYSQQDRLKAALADMFAMIDEGLLVRNTARDHEPDYAIRSLMFVRRLGNAHAALVSESQQNGEVQG